MPGGNGVRVDTAQYAEGVVPPYYDSLIAKLIVHGVDRDEAIASMERALSQFVVQGIDTSIPLHQEIFADPETFAPANSTPSSWSASWPDGKADPGPDHPQFPPSRPSPADTRYFRNGKMCGTIPASPVY